MGEKEKKIKKEAVSKGIYWLVLPLCYFFSYFVILCGSII
jgi:hypothetical protein